MIKMSMSNKINEGMIVNLFWPDVRLWEPWWAWLLNLNEDSHWMHLMVRGIHLGKLYQHYAYRRVHTHDSRASHTHTQHHSRDVLRPTWYIRNTSFLGPEFPGIATEKQTQNTKHKKTNILGCIKCMRCRLLLLMIAVSVCHAAQLAHFGLLF